MLEFHFNPGLIVAQIDKFSERTYVGPIRHRSKRAAVVPAKLVASVVKSACSAGSFRKAGRLAFVLWLQSLSSESFECNKDIGIRILLFCGDPMEINQKVATPFLFL